MNMNLFIRLFIFTILIFPYSLHANKNKALKNITMESLAKVALKHNISIIDWQNTPQSKQYKIYPHILKNEKDLINFLKKKFNNWAITHSPNHQEFYLLPKGISPETVQKIKSNDSTKKKNILPSAKPGQLKKTGNYKKFSQLIQIKKFAKKEKIQGLHFERFINPKTFVSAYSFDVEYIKALDSMMPVKKNGKSQAKILEGFTSPSEFYRFLLSKSKWWTYANKNTLFMSTDQQGNKGMIRIVNNNDHTLINAHIIISENKKMNYHIKLNDQSFKTTTTIHSESGPITLLDYATLGSRR
ncbi:hypothetical protein MHK_006395 [Candidatus Magnetomorum sp. HK-1]|nr:hypothetical protein MHK_006395 [Candidatus Magnetomorum sp. HK-1]